MRRHFTVYYNNFIFIYIVHPHLHINGKGAQYSYFFYPITYKNDEITNNGKSCRVAHSAIFQAKKASEQDFVSHQRDCSKLSVEIPHFTRFLVEVFDAAARLSVLSRSTSGGPSWS